MNNRYGDIRFIHFADSLRDIPLNGGATVAYKVMGDAVIYAAAFCSPDDIFIKSYGRERSAGLLRQLMRSPQTLTFAFEDMKSGYVQGNVNQLAMLFENNGYESRRTGGLDSGAQV